VKPRQPPSGRTICGADMFGDWREHEVLSVSPFLGEIKFTDGTEIQVPSYYASRVRELVPGDQVHVRVSETGLAVTVKLKEAP
jgi:hypothetical protein